LIESIITKSSNYSGGYGTEKQKHRKFIQLLFGHFGDKYGRRLVLIISVTMISCSTVSIGLLPTYSSIGIYAPFLLLLCRILQGLSMCGEEIGAALFF